MFPLQVAISKCSTLPFCLCSSAFIFCPQSSFIFLVSFIFSPCRFSRPPLFPPSLSFPFLIHFQPKLIFQASFIFLLSFLSSPNSFPALNYCQPSFISSPHFPDCTYPISIFFLLHSFPVPIGTTFPTFNYFNPHPFPSLINFQHNSLPTDIYFFPSKF